MEAKQAISRRKMQKEEIKEKRIQKNKARIEKRIAKSEYTKNQKINKKRELKEKRAKKENITSKTVEATKNILIKYINKEEKNVKSGKIEKSADRLEILKKIEKLEEEGRFDVDAENDPPTIILTPENIDYLRKSMTSKIKRLFANEVGEMFLDNLLRNNKLIIKQINGMENIKEINTGAMVTCNHFNPFDCFAVEKAFELSGKMEDKRLYKVIREGNYTNFPGLYGFFFRNCDTLPLSSNKRTMVEFMKAVGTLLKNGDFILIYPEQSMWWNYRKPKPLKIGAYKMAAKNDVPVIPIFITMEDSDIIGEDGFPIQEYTINIKEAIYPDKNLSEKENVDIMKEKNYEVWKEVYEEFYKIPLEYTTKKEKVNI